MEKTMCCDSDTLMIADEKRAVAMAGVMGGSDTGVDENTRNILLEGAFFTPQVVRGKTGRHNLNPKRPFILSAEWITVWRRRLCAVPPDC